MLPTGRDAIDTSLRRTGIPFVRHLHNCFVAPPAANLPAPATMLPAEKDCCDAFLISITLMFAQVFQRRLHLRAYQNFAPITASRFLPNDTGLPSPIVTRKRFSWSAVPQPADLSRPSTPGHALPIGFPHREYLPTDPS